MGSKSSSDPASKGLAVGLVGLVVRERCLGSAQTRAWRSPGGLPGGGSEALDSGIPPPSLLFGDPLRSILEQSISSSAQEVGNSIPPKQEFGPNGVCGTCRQDLGGLGARPRPRGHPEVAE